jgi:hypothetical protein
MSSRIASKTILNCASYVFSRVASLRATSTFPASIVRNLTNARMISTLTDTARALRRTLDSIATPCSVKAYVDERSLAERSNEPPVQTALDACAAIAMGRGHVATLPNAEAPDDDHDEGAAGKPAVAVERDGFNLHAGVRIECGDDVGRERLVRYGARPPLSLERLRRLLGGRVAYRLKYVTRGRGKFRVMTGLEFMARLAAIVAPPRYPLVRYAGVLGRRTTRSSGRSGCRRC